MLSASNLSYHHGGRAIVSDVSLKVEAGQALALVGPNGAGKTTLLRCLAGLLKPQSGKVKLDGDEISTLSRRALATKIGYVPQIFECTVPYTVEEFLYISRYARNALSKALSLADRQAVARAVELTGTAPYLNRAITELSGGERQKILIASVLTQEPSILLLDEPATYLDLSEEHLLQNMIFDLRRSLKLGVVLITHDLNAATLYCDNVLALVKGKAKFFGTPAEFIGSEDLYKVFKGSFLTVNHPTRNLNMVLPT